MGKILITDDALFMRFILKNILVKGGYEVVGEADTGVNAIAKFKELKPDLITMDITMPGMDGVSALKEIKKLDNQAKVIMCSAMGQQSRVRDAIELGARDFILKPFREERVLEAVKKVLG